MYYVILVLTASSVNEAWCQEYSFSITMNPVMLNSCQRRRVVCKMIKALTEDTAVTVIISHNLTATDLHIKSYKHQMTAIHTEL